MNQSPFNVGTRLTLEDFTLEQVQDLNRRHGSPLHSRVEVEQFYRLIGGQPFLVRRGLYEMRLRNIDLAALTEQAPHDEGLFGDHLRRILVLLAQNERLCEAVRELLQGRSNLELNSFYRLRSAGVLAGETARKARLRCQLYTLYLERHLL